MKIRYDQEADVLYVTCSKPIYTDCVEHSASVILRLDPEAERVAGFTIIDFFATLHQTGIGYHASLRG